MILEIQFGEGGEDMSDLTDVPPEDFSGVSGYDYAPAAPQPKYRIPPRIPVRLPPPPSVGGLR